MHCHGRMLATSTEEACGLEVRDCHKLIALQHHVALSGAKEAIQLIIRPRPSAHQRRDEGARQ